MKRYFIVGTDTDCGKTYVTCQLIDYFKQNNARVRAIKPVASGCIDGISDDVQRLDKHQGISLNEPLFWRLKRPISPHLAAAEEGVLLTAERIAHACALCELDTLDYLLIEGAGGLMVPFNQEETWLDFLQLTGIPVLLVVGMRLGCINHARLTDFVLKAHHIECAGWIANCLDPMMDALDDNIQTIADTLSVPHIATVPYRGILETCKIF